jgi:hypothetical protein
MLRSLALGLLLSATPVAAGTPQPVRAPRPGAASPPAAAPRQLFERGETSVRSLLTNILFPTKAGTLSLKEAREASHPGEGIDTGLLYESEDREVFGTIYLYYPAFAHAGAAAYATDRALQANSETPLRRLGSSVVAVGASPSSAIRQDYENYRGRASSAAFVKVGRWIIKLRVTGPMARASEVSEAMTRFLAGIRLPDGIQPRPAAPLTVSDCAGSGPRSDAPLKPDGTGAHIAGNAFLATFDPGGAAASNERGRAEALPSRVPDRWCISGYTGEGGGRIPIMRAADGDALSVDGRSVILVPVSDSGDMIEVVHAGNRGGYQLLYHQLGLTQISGLFTAMPSDRQIAELFQAESVAGRARALVRHKPDGNSEIVLPDSLGSQPET